MAICSAAGAALFLFLVWPTPYIMFSRGDTFYRLNRFSGVREVSTSEGWKTESAIERESERRRADEESRTAAERWKSRAAELALEEQRALAPIQIGSAHKITASCALEYRDGNLLARLSLAPYAGTLAKIEQQSPEASSVTPRFLDKNGFAICSSRIGMNEFTREINEAGEAAKLVRELTIALSEEDYKRIDRFTVEWSWPVALDVSSTEAVDPGRDAARLAATRLADGHALPGPYPTGANASSEFVADVFKTLGISLPSDLKQQTKTGKEISRLEHLRPGDRVYFWDASDGRIAVAGIYVGEGYFIHAPNEGGRVQRDYLGQPNWRKELVSARR